MILSKSMVLIVGLGNPGESYERTRHNIGFMVLDSLLKKLTNVKDSVWEENKKFNSTIAKIGEDLVLAKPSTFMNSSGTAVSKIINFYKIPFFGLYLVHDDVDLPLGKIKISIDKGSAGHKGVESVMKTLGENNFVRIRVGVGKDAKISTDKYVLLPFESSDENGLKHAIKKAVEAIEEILKVGAEKAATRYNQ